MTSNRPSGRRVHRLAALLALTAGGLVAGVGCQTAPAPKATDGSATAAPISPERTAAVRASVLRLQPDAVVGTVIDTMMLSGNASTSPDRDRPYTAIGDVRVQDVKVGQALSFLDGNGQPINHGTVVRVEGDMVFARYDRGGQRAPIKGDTAVWMK